VIQNLLRLAAKYQPRNAASTMRRHYDQVATGSLRRRDDRLVGALASFRERVALDPCQLGFAPQRREQLVRVGVREYL
jgi:hypothetical protein